MKRSEELKITKTQKVTRMQTIVDEANKREENKRSLTTEEQTEWDNLDGEVRSLETEITRALRMEELEAQGYSGGQAHNTNNGQDGEGGEGDHQNGGQGPTIKRKAAPYSVGKAIREFARGADEGLTGVEKEQHDELSRGISSTGLLVPHLAPGQANTVHSRDQNATSNAAAIDTVIDPNLSVIGKEPLYQSMGLTILPGLTGTLKIGKKTADEAEKVAEKAELTQTAAGPTFATMTPERYGITDIFTKELLAQENPAVHAAIVNDMVKGCDRKITADVYTAALAAATEVATGALTVAGFNALMAAVDLDGAFAMDRTSFFSAKGVKVDAGSAKFLVELTGKNGMGRTHDGANAFYSTLFTDGVTQQYAIYGAWEEMYLGFWGALEILINPFTYQKKGQIEMTVNRLADIVCRNAGAFVKTPDLEV